MAVVERCTEPPPTKVEGISGLERLRRTVGPFPTEVGGFKPDLWKMNALVGFQSMLLPDQIIQISRRLEEDRHHDSHDDSHQSPRSASASKPTTTAIPYLVS